MFEPANIVAGCVTAGKSTIMQRKKDTCQAFSDVQLRLQLSFDPA